MAFKDILRQRAKKSVAVKALEVFSPHHIILSPMMTEKAYKDANTLNKYVLKVHADANKNDVKSAIKTLYNVTPEAIHIINAPFKGRANRKLVRRASKKAIVTLKKNDKLDTIA